MSRSNRIIGHTEELLAGTAFLHDLNETGFELLNGGNMVGENTHLTGLGGDVNLDTVAVEKARQYTLFKAELE